MSNWKFLPFAIVVSVGLGVSLFISPDYNGHWWETVSILAYTGIVCCIITMMGVEDN